VNAIGTLPFATEEPTVARTFDQNLIRTSFANLCMVSCPIHTARSTLWFFFPIILGAEKHGFDSTEATCKFVIREE
jgi:hypothetical protein